MTITTRLTVLNCIRRLLKGAGIEETAKLLADRDYAVKRITG
jgi:hypothetical protein